MPTSKSKGTQTRHGHHHSSFSRTHSGGGTPIRHTRHYENDEYPGAEPGVNPRSGLSAAEYSHFKQECVIDVIDYDSDDASFQRLTNTSLIQLLGEKTPMVNEEVDLPPKMVRWINIGGIDWSVLSAIALKYNLHSLALEDILHERGHNHSKADYYPGHLFIRILCHSLYEDEPANMFHSASKEDAVISREPSDLDLEEGMYSAVPPGLDKKVATGESPKMNERGADTPNLNGKDQTTEKPDPSRFSLRKRFSSLSGFRGPDREKQLMQIFALTKNERVFIKHEPMFIFLLHDGTVISIRPSSNLDYTSAISERLHRPDSVLRTSEDPSLLVESFLDLIVDRVLEVVDEYQVKINKLEHDILLNPDMNCVRSLHILSGDLIMHKRTLEPIKTMIHGLRRYDLDRCLALAETMAMDTTYASDVDETESSTLNEPSGQDQDGDEDAEDRRKAEGRDKKSKAKRKRRRERAHATQERMKGDHQRFQKPLLQSDSGSSISSGSGREEEERRVREGEAAAKKRQRMTAKNSRSRKIEGYFSYKAKVYLADVYDHMDFALTSLDMFSGISENLINYAFNMASYEMNYVMKRLTLVTIIFLPLTLLTGYFGMNFTPFWSVDKNSDAFFWKIAAPVMAVLLPIFLLDDIKKFIRYSQQRWEVREATKGL